MTPVPLHGHQLKGLSEIADKYDVFIIDLWGVIYNGKKVFSSAYQTLKELKAMGKIVYLTTNSPRVRSDALSVLEKVDLSSDMFTELITAGQKTLELFQMNIIAPAVKRPLKAFIIDHGRLCNWADEAKLVSVENVGEADIILAVHMDEDLIAPDPYVPVFRQAIDRDVLFVCANPDKYIMDYGSRKSRVGILSDLYKVMGGKAVDIGKPHPIMFEEVMMTHAGKSFLLIGDSLVTDIQAAEYLGIDSLLITRGYHQEEFHSVQAVKQGDVYQVYGVSPTYVCEQLFW